MSTRYQTPDGRVPESIRDRVAARAVDHCFEVLDDAERRRAVVEAAREVGGRIRNGAGRASAAVDRVALHPITIAVAGLAALAGLAVVATPKKDRR